MMTIRLTPSVQSVSTRWLPTQPSPPVTTQVACFSTTASASTGRLSTLFVVGVNGSSLRRPSALYSPISCFVCSCNIRYDAGSFHAGDNSQIRSKIDAAKCNCSSFIPALHAVGSSGSSLRRHLPSLENQGLIGVFLKRDYVAKDTATAV